MRQYNRLGIIGRFKPVHNGHAIILETICKRAMHVHIGLGSCNRLNVRNPFTAQESAEMIDLVLKPQHTNYSLITVPDFDNGPLWRENALKLWGNLDCFVTANDYVKSLLKNDYKIVHPLEVLSVDNRERVNATMVRVAMAQGQLWEHFVPESVADYLKQNKLVERFVNEFGLETLSSYSEQILKGEVTW